MTLAALVAFLSPYPLALGTSMTLVLIFHLFLHGRVYPYAQSVHAANQVEALSLFVSLVLMLLATLVFLVKPEISEPDYKVYCGICMSGLTLLCYSTIATLVAKDIWRAFKAQVIRKLRYRNVTVSLIPLLESVNE